MTIQLHEQSLPGLFLLVAEPVRDKRGSFTRVFDAPLLEAQGLESCFRQRAIADNRLAGTIRGLHFAAEPHTEVKIVSCLRGAIFDVVVDLRDGSPTHGHWTGFQLSQQSSTFLYIPRGFAHGYQTLADDTQVAYDISAPYVAAAARGIRYDDRDLAIPWPLTVTSLSPRDAQLPGLRVDPAAGAGRFAAKPQT